MTVTDAASTERPKHLWSHLIVAAVLSTLVPNLGAVYLRLPAPSDKVAWQWHSSGLVMLPLFLAITFSVVSLNLAALMLFVGLWLFSGAVTAVQNMWLALRN